MKWLRSRGILTHLSISLAALLVVLMMIGMWAAQASGEPGPERRGTGQYDVPQLSEDLFDRSERVRRRALKKIVQRGDLDMAPTLILAMRYIYDDGIVEAFQDLTDSQAEDWFEAMLWQQARPEIAPHPSFRELKLGILADIDSEFLRFLGGERGTRENMRIRLEEITWGGVIVDGIPSLDDPQLISAAEAGYLRPSDLVFGVEINGDARAYPLRIMGWHEMFNDVIGGEPVALAYCTLCGSGILYETKVEGRKEPFRFGSSGFLYRSNKLMFDRQTDSLWNQFTGRPVSGPLVDSGIELKRRPVVITTWDKWRKSHEDTKVLSLNTGHQRDYGSGVVYRDYFSSPELMFPSLTQAGADQAAKDYVFGVRIAGRVKAWPLEVFENGAVINDSLGALNLVLVGDAETRTVRAYDRGKAVFSAEANDELAGPGGTWRVAEDALIGPNGESAPRVAGHIAYWFAWDGFVGRESELYSGESDT